MPVVATETLTPNASIPAVDPTVEAPLCPTRRIVTPGVGRLYKLPLSGQRRCAVITQGQATWLQFPVLTRDGVEYDPTDCPTGSSESESTPTPAVKLRFREATGFAPNTYEVEGAMTVDYHLQAYVPADVVNNAGVYEVFAITIDSSGYQLDSNTFYLLVERGAFTLDGSAVPTMSTMPTVAEVRNALRDFPQTNRLLDDWESFESNVADALVDAVMRFNSAPPPLDCVFTTHNFPWRRNWLDGALVHLLTSIAHHMVRSDLQYSAGGMTVADLNKGRDYLSLAESYRQRWEQWVKMTRVQINWNNGFGSLMSSYS